MSRQDDDDYKRVSRVEGQPLPTSHSLQSSSLPDLDELEDELEDLTILGEQSLLPHSSGLHPHLPDKDKKNSSDPTLLDVLLSMGFAQEQIRPVLQALSLPAVGIPTSASIQLALDALEYQPQQMGSMNNQPASSFTQVQTMSPPAAQPGLNQRSLVDDDIQVVELDEEDGKDSLDEDDDNFIITDEEESLVRGRNLRQAASQMKSQRTQGASSYPHHPSSLMFQPSPLTVSESVSSESINSASIPNSPLPIPTLSPQVSVSSTVSPIRGKRDQTVLDDNISLLLSLSGCAWEDCAQALEIHNGDLNNATEWLLERREKEERERTNKTSSKDKDPSNKARKKEKEAKSSKSSSAHRTRSNTSALQMSSPISKISSSANVDQHNNHITTHSSMRHTFIPPLTRSLSSVDLKQDILAVRMKVEKEILHQLEESDKNSEYVPLRFIAFGDSIALQLVHIPHTMKLVIETDSTPSSLEASESNQTVSLHKQTFKSFFLQTRQDASCLTLAPNRDNVLQPEKTLATPQKANSSFNTSHDERRQDDIKTSPISGQTNSSNKGVDPELEDTCWVTLRNPEDLNDTSPILSWQSVVLETIDGCYISVEVDGSIHSHRGSPITQFMEWTILDSKLPNRVAPVLPSQKVYLQAKSGQLLLGADEEKYKQTLSKAAKKDFITSSLGTLSNLKEEKDSSDAKTASYQSIRMSLFAKAPLNNSSVSTNFVWRVLLQGNTPTSHLSSSSSLISSSSFSTPTLTRHRSASFSPFSPSTQNSPAYLEKARKAILKRKNQTSNEAKERWNQLKNNFRLVALHMKKAEITELNQEIFRHQRLLQRSKEEDSLCCLCLDQLHNTVFLNCGHICCCSDCAPSLTNCPICRKQIARVVTIKTT